MHFCSHIFFVQVSRSVLLFSLPRLYIPRYIVRVKRLFQKEQTLVALSLMYPLSVGRGVLLHKGEIVKTPLLNLSGSFTYPPRSQRIFSEYEGLVELIFTVREGREKIEKERVKEGFCHVRGYV